MCGRRIWSRSEILREPREERDRSVRQARPEKVPVLRRASDDPPQQQVRSTDENDLEGVPPRLEEIAENRRSQVGTGERSEKIRTYNYPQSRVTDHRINLTLYNLARIVSGDELGEIIQPSTRGLLLKLGAKPLDTRFVSPRGWTRWCWVSPKSWGK